jgi:hypothetical protein
MVAYSVHLQRAAPQYLWTIIHRLLEWAQVQSTLPALDPPVSVLAVVEDSKDEVESKSFHIPAASTHTVTLPMAAINPSLYVMQQFLTTAHLSVCLCNVGDLCCWFLGLSFGVLGGVWFCLFVLHFIGSFSVLNSRCCCVHLPLCSSQVPFANTVVSQHYDRAPPSFVQSPSSLARMRGHPGQQVSPGIVVFGGGAVALFSSSRVHLVKATC